MNKEKRIDSLKNDLLKSEFWCFNEETGRFELDRQKTARNLHHIGYRKTSDIAREIFEEIEEMLNLQAKIVCQTRGTVMKADEPPLSYMAMLDGRIYSIRVVEEHIAELKKKYTEEGK